MSPLTSIKGTNLSFTPPEGFRVGEGKFLQDFICDSLGAILSFVVIDKEHAERMKTTTSTPVKFDSLKTKEEHFDAFEQNITMNGSQVVRVTEINNEYATSRLVYLKTVYSPKVIDVLFVFQFGTKRFTILTDCGFRGEEKVDILEKLLAQSFSTIQKKE